jgi:hypothetical protein
VYCIVLFNFCQEAWLAEDGGVEPHPIPENLVFKASRRTIPPASSSKHGTLDEIRTHNLGVFPSSF